MTRPTINMLLSGVGGQGVVLASFVLSHVAIAEGYDVKQSEVHGMSQRGGSVTSHFRFGDKVWAPLVSPGAADILMAFESLEALRYINWLKPGGLLVYNSQKINPSPVAAGLATYPQDIDGKIAAAWPNVQCVKANELAIQAGTVKSANVVMLGAVSPALPFAQETWEAVIRKAVPPKSVDVNMKAFQLGVATAANPSATCSAGAA
jgi:indolepyruvate ferredoxin oxidoreductase, beta subunit